MSERKVLNKYYPPDFDPSNIPRMKTQKNRPFNIRIMAPMNMRCNTCGEYIYKGKKFNSRKEDVEDEYYLGLRIFRFYIKCPRCVSEIAFKTDLENTDYTLEAGATRLFEAEKLARQMAEQEIKAKEDEELNNPMKVLENRTKASRNEIEQIDALEELREMNSRHAKLDHAEMLQMHAEYEKHLARLQDEEDEKEIRAIFGATEDGKTIKRLREDDSDMLDEDKPSATKKLAVSQKATDILTQEASDRTSIATAKASIQPQAWEKSIGGLGNRNSLKNLVRKKKSTDKSTVLVQPSQTGSVNLVKESNDSVDSEKLQDTCSEISSEQVTSLRQTYDNTGEKNTTQNQPGSVEGKPVMNGSMSDTPCGVKSSSLGLLGDYSDSESNESDC